MARMNHRELDAALYEPDDEIAVDEHTQALESEIRDMEFCVQKIKDFEEKGIEALAPPVQAYINALSDNDYDPQVTAHLMC